MRIKIDNEILEVEKVNSNGVTMTDATEWFLFADSDSAGQNAREYWVDMAENDRKEFVCIVGEENLVSWALGDFAGPGQTQVKSLEEWFDLWLDVPEEHHATYDGAECIVDRVGHLSTELGFVPTVAYRTN